MSEAFDKAVIQTYEGLIGEMLGRAIDFEAKFRLAQLEVSQLKKMIEEMRERPLFASMDMELFFNQGRMVRSSIFNLVQGGQIGGVLAALVLYFFLPVEKSQTG